MSNPMPIPSESTIVKITPELAADWLEHRNNSNRKLSQPVASRYAKAMKEGRWLTTHQGIAFDKDGFLIDGQHRLQAIALAGIPIELFVAVGFSTETFAVLDNGHRRLAGQLVKGKYGNIMAAAARFLGAVDGTFTSDVSYGVYAHRADNDQVLAVISAWPELQEYAPLASAASAGGRVTPAPHLAVAAQAARTQYAPRLTDWFKGVTEGFDLPKGDPRGALRSRFIRDSRLSAGSTGRITTYVFITKAWNAYAVGAELNILRFRDEENPPAVVS